MVAIEHMLPCSGGGQLTRRPHALSYDGESVILCNSHRLCVYSTLSGERIYDLHDHVGEVTGVCLHPRLKNQVCFFYRDSLVPNTFTHSCTFCRCIHVLEMGV